MKKLIIANWKMNGNIEKVAHDLENYELNPITNQDNIIFALPYIFLTNAMQIHKTKNAKYNICSQDISQFDGVGAYTGEVSGKMLSELGVNYSIIGHSERRKMGESGDILVKKLESAANNKIIPIFCIGESYEDRVENLYITKLQQELSILLQVQHPIDSIIVAYEPIWAIGTGLTPNVDQVVEVMNLIQTFVQNNFSNISVKTIYGGSVVADNAQEFLNNSSINGLLVGGASLKVEEFIKICSWDVTGN